jgi:hypothetical protein
MKVMYYTLNIIPASFDISMLFNTVHTQAFVSFKKYMPLVSNFREGARPGRPPLDPPLDRYI